MHAKRGKYAKKNHDAFGVKVRSVLYIFIWHIFTELYFVIFCGNDVDVVHQKYVVEKVEKARSLALAFYGKYLYILATIIVHANRHVVGHSFC